MRAPLVALSITWARESMSKIRVGLASIETEPPNPENPLLRMENIILTPHVASASARMAPETRRRVGQEGALVLTGRWPRTCVNPAVLPKTDLRRWQPFSMERGPGA